MRDVVAEGAQLAAKRRRGHRVEQPRNSWVAEGRQSRGEVVALLGQRDDVATLMSAADVWCVPSRWEGLGSILVEAMCLEVPVVASAVPAICEIAGDPAAFTLVQPDDPNALARGVLDVLSNPAFAEQRSTIAYGRFLSEFTADDIAQRMIGFYERSLASSRIANSRKGGRAFTG